MGIVRWPNLLIVALTQYLLQYLVLLPALQKAGISPTLDHWHFFLFVLTTLLITAGGYIINDILDYETDLVNKPGKVFINTSFSRKKASWLYLTLSLLGLAVAWHLAVFVEKPSLVLIYPGAVFGLWLYSRFFKKMPLLGNLVVALFCADVAGIVLFAEREAFASISVEQPALAGRISLLFGGYVLFAFLSTLLREIIKDVEDVEGDAVAGLRTLPIVSGFQMAKRAAIFLALSLLLIMLSFAWWLYKNDQWLGLVFAGAAIIFPNAGVVFLLVKAARKEDFSQLSFFTKLIMAAGLVLLVLISI